MPSPPAPEPHLSRHLNGQLEVAAWAFRNDEALHITDPIYDGLRVLVVLDGAMSLRAGRDQSVTVSTPTSIAVFSEGNATRDQVFDCGRPFKSVLLTIGRDLVQGELGLHPFALLTGDPSAKPDGVVLRARAAGASVRAVAAQLGTLESRSPLYTCAKAMELAALVLDGFRTGERSDARARMPRVEIERIRHAREMLLASLESPPDVATLAQLCGTNPIKLTRGFRALYGTTPYALLQEHRLEEARKLLGEGSRSVSEIAALCGYTPAHFANLFRRRFGLAPSSLIPRFSKD